MTRKDVLLLASDIRAYLWENCEQTSIPYIASVIVEIYNTGAFSQKPILNEQFTDECITELEQLEAEENSSGECAEDCGDPNWLDCEDAKHLSSSISCNHPNLKDSYCPDCDNTGAKKPDDLIAVYKYLQHELNHIDKYTITKEQFQNAVRFTNFGPGGACDCGAEVAKSTHANWCSTK